MDYKQHQILTRSKKTGKFEKDSRVDSCLIVGSAVEAYLRLSYRPAVGVMPLPLQFCKPCHLKSVDLRDVLPPEYERAVKSWPTKVSHKDAQLALDVLQDGLSKLMSPPYNLEVLTCDHGGATSCDTSHDSLLSTRMGSKSCLADGLYSLEIRCREVMDRRAFPWEDTLTSEAGPLWRAELEQQSSGVWQGRMLLLAEFARPCHSAGYTLHASVLKKGATEWERMWGWSGFGASTSSHREPVVANSSRSPCAKAKATAAAVPKARAVAVPKAKAATHPRAPAPNVSERWRKVRSKFDRDGPWVKLTSFVSRIKGLCSGQTKRFVEGPGPHQWKVGVRGRALVQGSDWSRRSGKRGGGAGSGYEPIWVKEDCLEEVFRKYYFNKEIMD